MSSSVSLTHQVLERVGELQQANAAKNQPSRLEKLLTKQWCKASLGALCPAMAVTYWKTNVVASIFAVLAGLSVNGLAHYYLYNQEVRHINLSTERKLLEALSDNTTFAATVPELHQIYNKKVETFMQMQKIDDVKKLNLENIQNIQTAWAVECHERRLKEADEIRSAIAAAAA